LARSPLGHRILLKATSNLNLGSQSVGIFHSSPVT
jgi:hypothetical protein